MEAIVLAGGLGTRLEHILNGVPKPMALISGSPFLEILLSNLSLKGFKRVVLALGYKANLIKSHFGERFSGLHITYVEENFPLGTGGAVRLAMSECKSDHVFIFNGDTYIDLEVDKLEDLWTRHQETIIVGREVFDTSRFGRLSILNGRINGFNEKGVSGCGMINAGCYVIGTKDLVHAPLNSNFSLENDYFPQLLSVRDIAFFQTRGLFIDIGVPQDYLKAQELLKPFIPLSDLGAYRTHTKSQDAK